MTRGALLPLSAAVLFGCTKGQPSPQGASEPFRVRGAQFIAGKLPGLEPSDAAPTPVGDAGSEQGPPSVTQFQTPFSYVFQGQGAQTISGLITANGWTVGLQMVGIGTGYWVIPAGDVDPASKTKELTWSASCDFGLEIPAGYHFVRAVALDQGGHAGPQLEKRLCVGSILGESLTPCDPTIPPPEAIIALRWDTNVDLDLQVVTPDGRLVDPKHPATAEPGEGGTLPPEAGAFDRDSNAGCVIDGIRHEDLIWKDVAPTGRYLIYVNLFDACKQPAVRFEASVYTAVPNPDVDGGKELQQWWKQGGELLDFQANGGAAIGLYISEFDFF